MPNKEYRNTADRNLIFAEYFNSEQSCIENRITPSNVEFINGKARFNGVNSIATVSLPEIYKADTFSIRIRAKFNTHLNFGGLFTLRSGAALYGFYLTGIENQLAFSYNGGRVYGLVTPGEYFDAVFVYDGTIGDLFTYYNGDIVQSGVFAAPGSISVQGDWNIGFDNTKYTDCDFDLIEIYNSALTAEEISNLYNGNRNRSLPNKNIVVGGRAIKFNGTSQYAYIADAGKLDVNKAETDYGISGYVTTPSSMSSSQGVFGKFVGGASINGACGIFISGSTLYARLHTLDGIFNVSDNITLEANTEYHVYFRVDLVNSLLYFYIDGVLQNPGGTAYTGTIASLSSSFKFMVGCANDDIPAGDPILYADITARDIRVFHGDVSSELSAIMNGEVTGKEIAWWTFEDEDSGYILDAAPQAIPTYYANTGVFNLTTVNFDASSFIIGNWTSILSKYGYNKGSIISNFLLYPWEDNFGVNDRPRGWDKGYTEDASNYIVSTATGYRFVSDGSQPVSLYDDLLLTVGAQYKVVIRSSIVSGSYTLYNGSTAVNPILTISESGTDEFLFTAVDDGIRIEVNGVSDLEIQSVTGGIYIDGYVPLDFSEKDFVLSEDLINEANVYGGWFGSMTETPLGDRWIRMTSAAGSSSTLYMDYIDYFQREVGKPYLVNVTLRVGVGTVGVIKSIDDFGNSNDFMVANLFTPGQVEYTDNFIIYTKSNLGALKLYVKTFDSNDILDVRVNYIKEIISYTPATPTLDIGGNVAQGNSPIADDSLSIKEILNVSAESGVIRNKYSGYIINGSLVPDVIPTNVTVKREGSISVIECLGDGGSNVNCGSYDDLTGDITFLAWMKPRELVTFDRIISNTQLDIYFASSSDRIYIKRSAGISAYASFTNISEQKWYFIAITSDSIGDSLIYLNGIPSNMSSSDAGIPTIGGDIKIGINEAASSFPFDGRLSDIKLIKGILTAEEISQIYTNEKHKYNV